MPPSSCVRSEAPAGNFNLSVRAPNRTLAKKSSESPNVGSDLRGMDLGHARGWILQNHLHDGPFYKVVGSGLLNHLHFG